MADADPEDDREIADLLMSGEIDKKVELRTQFMVRAKIQGKEALKRFLDKFVNRHISGEVSTRNKDL